MKRKVALLLICAVLCLFQIGCGKQSDQTDQTTPESGASEETDEEYVYDYQVSMEPIPKEIADLGGPCQGTIHAFPSKIRIGLTEKRMEEDPELKAEVQKRIPEIEQELAEKIGGKFRVDGVDATDEMYWKIQCTELDTGEQFYVTYDNSAYATRRDEKPYLFGNQVLTSEYYGKKESDKMRETMVKLCSKVYEDGCYNVWCDTGTGVVVSDMRIYIAQFREEEVDRKDEQKKIKTLWEALHAYSDTTEYSIKIIYFPMEYKEVIAQKFASDSFNDWDMVSQGNEATRLLIENNEIKDSFLYESILNGREMESYLYEDKVWSYWVKK